ncbi:MAG: Omp28-related outer membrane protein [Bacteroides sp.]|nr:Omp28-related outer membrane protein [Bacteroides sp.]MCM1380070.1 Omp28-related outer membrane protein [Bacteroides sp.]MCM1446407.1 Omp28-related outer membrane protein [Prevotella sp.]
MKIKQLLPLILLGALTACEDKIDERYSVTTAPKPNRTVLVEEYTGTSCSNCPAGHRIIESLEKIFNTEENFEQGLGMITVSIHIPKWGYSVSLGGFITPEASSLLPKGMTAEEMTPPQAQINRNGKVVNRTDWTKAIADELSRAPEVTFPDRPTATASGSSITVSGVVQAPQNISAAKLHVWLVEDNIVFLQNDGGVNIRDYVHNNVYRAHMTESYAGEDFPLTRNSPEKFSFTYPINEKWNPANMRAVVFVESPTSGVLNATQAPVILQ